MAVLRCSFQAHTFRVTSPDGIAGTQTCRYCGQTERWHQMQMWDVPGPCIFEETIPDSIARRWLEEVHRWQTDLGVKEG